LTEPLDAPHSADLGDMTSVMYRAHSHHRSARWPLQAVLRLRQRS